MCEFASFVLTKDNAFWLSDSDSHEKIISHYNLQHLDKDPIGVVRVEVIPPKTSVDNLDSWKFQVDQDVYPDWTFKGDPSLEIRTREALYRRAVEEKWFEIVTGQHVMAGKFGIVSAGDGGLASAGDWGAASVGDFGTAFAGINGKATAGYDGTAIAGNRGTASVGTYGTAIAGDWGTASAGKGGKASTGYGGTASVGDYGTASVGNWGTATAGDRGTAIAGDRGTAISGYYGTATAGDRGKATSGDFGKATTGYDGTASAGNQGTIIVQWFDPVPDKRRTLVGYIGEEGLEPNTKYRVVKGSWVKVD